MARIRDSQLGDFEALNDLFRRSNQRYLVMAPHRYRAVETPMSARDFYLSHAWVKVQASALVCKVAVDEHEDPVGVALAFKRNRSEHGWDVYENYAYLEHIWVDPDHRGEGIGTRLMEGVRHWQKFHNLPEMRAMGPVENEAGGKFLAKFGMFPARIEYSTLVPSVVSP